MAEHVFNLSQGLPFLPSSPASPPSVGCGDLLELLLYGDQGEQSLWDSDASKILALLASPQPPMLPSPPPTPPTATSPPSTILRSILTPKSPITTLPEPPVQQEPPPPPR